MAAVKQSIDSESPSMLPASYATADVEHESDHADFELDDILRRLTLDRWFATAKRDVPIWAF